MDAKKLVESMDIESVITWADLTGVECDMGPWNGDEYSEKHAALRVALTDRLNASLSRFFEEIDIKKPVKVGTSSGLPPGIVRRLGALMREVLVDMLGNTDVQTDVYEDLYDRFFPGEVDEDYEKQVSKCCDELYRLYQQRLIQVLEKGE